MLPDYPKTKAKLRKQYRKLARESHQQHLGFFAGIRESIIHEGRVDKLVRADGTVSEVTPKLVQGKAFIPADSSDIEKLSMQDLLKGLHEASRALAEAKARMTLEAIEEATKRIGNEVGPNPDTVEQIFEMTEKRQIDFDEQRQPIWGHMVVGDRETVERIRMAIIRIASTPELRDRWELLVEKKRREFLDREATRKLVD